MKLTTATPITTSRIHRRSGKGSSYKKLFTSHQKSLNGSKREILRETSPCDNSDDSGLGTENNADYLYNTAIPHPSVFRFANSQKRSVDDSFSLNSKRHRVDGREQHDLGDPYSPTLSHVSLSNLNSICGSPGMQTSAPTASKAIRRSLVPAKRFSGPVTLSSSLSATSRNGKVSLQILNQPEQQHRARYQTEGSRGAVKDRTGNSFPIVKVVGYNRLTTLQVFIGSDQGRVTPHMFYQACRVTGKNSTPCVEKNIEGTIAIEIDVEPSKDMTVTCDCVGILKERNVDVEHRFPEECSSRSKKKSTRCRMVFRTTITNDDGTTETLQVASQPIACTQPPGIPEICKKSLTNSSVSGGKELFILGKNFLKDTHVRFYTDDWEQLVTPDKEFLQQTHLVCIVPAYKSLDISETVNAKITVISGNRASEPHTFTYTPVAPVVSPVAPLALTANSLPRVTSPSAKNDSGVMKPDPSVDNPNAGLNQINENIIKTPKSPTDDCENVHPVMLWPASDLSSPTLIQNDSKMMPPPALPPRRSSVQMIVPDNVSSSNIKADVSNVGPGVVSHFPNAASSQLSNSVTRAYLPPQYPTISDCPNMIPDYTSSYRTMSDLDTSLKSDIAVPKLEPLSDSSNMCTNAYQASPTSDTHSTQMCISNMKNTVAAMRASQASDLYSNSHGYAYSSSEMYSSTSKNESEARSPVEDLSMFANPGPASTGLPSDSLGLLGSSNVSGMMLQSTQNVLNSNDTSNFVVDQSFQMNSGTANSNVLSTSRSLYLKNDCKMLMVNLSDSSCYNQNVKRKPYQFDKLFDMKSPQSLVSCSLKNSSSYENIRNTVCCKNPPSTESSVMPVYQNYLNLENTSTLNSSEDMLSSYGKLDANESSSSLDVVKSSMMLENAASSLMRETSRTARKNSHDYTLSISKTYSTKSLDDSNNSSYLSSQTQESIMSEFVAEPMMDNVINTVPKLEELVNCAAESHMRSANKSASLNLLNNSVISNSNCDRNSIQLDMFLNSETSQGGNCNAVHTAASPSRTNCVSENPLLVRNDEPASYQPATSAPRSVIEMSNVPNKPPDALELKKEKTVNVPGMSKKTEEGVFSSEISQMTENDLLSYINPSCFDEV